MKLRLLLAAAIFILGLAACAPTYTPQHYLVVGPDGSRYQITGYCVMDTSGFGGTRGINCYRSWDMNGPEGPILSMTGGTIIPEPDATPTP
jgi:hypothetical protein